MQVDLHTAELTVRETFDFAARVQGTKLKAGENVVTAFCCLPAMCMCRQQIATLRTCAVSRSMGLTG